MASLCAVITLATELDSQALDSYRQDINLLLTMNSYENNPVPAAMSHRQLSKLLQAATVKDVRDDQGEENTLGDELQAWAEATQKLLDSMSTSPETMTTKRTPHQVMALGSLRTHLMFGLQALKAAGCQ